MRTAAFRCRQPGNPFLRTSVMNTGKTRVVLSRYMVDYTKTHIPTTFGPLDGEGIPLFDPGLVRLTGAPLYHPIVIIQYGLAHHDLALDGDGEAKEVFVKCTRWLEENATEEALGRFVVWPYTFPIRTPRVRPPWISGMAQGQALSLLARAFLKTQSARTAEVAHRAARSFCCTVRDGGVVSVSESGAYIIEEVAHPSAIHILNGFLYGLFGLYEYLKVFEDADLQPVFEKCLRGVEEILPLFDMGWWSRYSLGVRWNVATPYYHDVHIRQLKHLAVLLNRPQFDLYAQRWEAYGQSSSLRLRRTVLGAVEVNVNRVLTVARLDRIKYRRVTALGVE